MDNQFNNSPPTPIFIIACKVFQKLLEASIPIEINADITYLDYGLHITPKNLTKEVQRSIDQIKTPSLVILGYGLCGNGLVGINSGMHTLIIPKSDDCIAILMGSYDDYRKEFDKEPGTYYLTKGWLESGSNPLQEYLGYIEKYGLEKADLIMDLQYKNYTRLMFVAQTKDDFVQYKGQVIEIAEFCRRWGMRYEEKLGSDRFIKDLITFSRINNSSKQQFVDQALGKDFVIIYPNRDIEQKYFFR